MAGFDVFHEYGKELEKRLRLQTFPLAIKMLKKESDIPEGAQRPMRDFGYHLPACQGFSMSRREGLTIAATLEDMWCPEAVIGYGLAKPPPYFFDGHQRFPQSAESLEAGSIWAREFPRLELGKYVGIVSAPLTKANFQPDVVVIYCDSTQLSTLLFGVASKEGRELTCTISAKGDCVYSVVPPILNGTCQVTTPCPGDRRFAGAQRDEMLFSLPLGRVEDLLKSFRYLDDYAYGIPFRCIMRPEPEIPGNYVEMAKMMGMGWLEGDEMAKYKKPRP